MYRRGSFVGGLVILTMAALSGCENDTNITEPVEGIAATPLFAAGGPNPRPMTWVDGEVFRGVVTPATFTPSSGNFDELYAGGNGFRNGAPLISESKPGDQDYNGGRWHLNVLKPGVDPDKYANADRVEDLDLNDFEATDAYFECPLLPARRGN